MTRELFWLTLTVVLTGILWIPYTINRCQIRGLGGAMANPSRTDKPQSEWANRLSRMTTPSRTSCCSRRWC